MSLDKIGFPGESDGKESTCNAGDTGSIPGKIPWRRKWLPTPVFLPGKPKDREDSPWGRKELDTTERLTLLLFRQVNFQL